MMGWESYAVRYEDGGASRDYGSDLLLFVALFNLSSFLAARFDLSPVSGVLPGETHRALE